MKTYLNTCKIATGLSAILAVTVFLNAIFPLPITQPEHSYARTIVSQNGELLRAFADDKGVWRYPVTLEQVSPNYIEALLNYEDRWFYWHPGFNPFAIIRALLQNIKSGRVISGGSTLSMQVARLIDPHSRTIPGKLKQILRAIQLEWYFSKQEILSYYLNHAPFGGPLEGVQVASLTYLGKSARLLSHAEAALLAVLPQAPSRLRPDRHAKRAEQARNKVLDRLLTLNVWTASQVQEAKIETVIKQWHRPAVVAPLLARRLKNKVQADKALVTTIDFSMQQSLEELVKQTTNRLPEKTSAAVLVVENESLAVKSYIGSSDFMDSGRYGHVDMVQATRSPGSTLKPFLYALAMDAGLIHSASLLVDAPSSFDGYRPSNFNRGFSGAVSVSDALTRSLNIPAVQVLHHFGANNFVSQLKNAGLNIRIATDGKANLAVILGGMGTQLESLVGLYSALANKGLSGKLRYLPDAPLQQKRFLSEGAAFIVKQLLERDIKGNKNKANAFAWKTGTSYGYRDMWSIGVSDKYTVGVWVGRPDGTPLPGYYGARTAAPLLFSIMQRIRPRQQQNRHLKQPASVTQTTICWPLGGAQQNTPEDQCHMSKKAWILEQNFPNTLIAATVWESNPLTVLLNKQTGLRVNASCLPKQSTQLKKALWPLAVKPWIEPEFRRNYQIPGYEEHCLTHSSQDYQPLMIKGIRNNTVLKSSASRFGLPTIQLNSTGGQGKRFWYLNGQELATSNASQRISHTFNRSGNYQIIVIDSVGNIAMVNFELK